MRGFALALLLTSALVAPAGALAAPGGAGPAAGIVVAGRPPAAGLLPARRLDLATPVAAPEPEEPAAAGDAAHRSYVLPVLLSAIVPGAGEIATGHIWRGLPLVALDVASWLARAHYQEQGRDWRDKYQAFADEHWHESLPTDSLWGDRNHNGERDLPDEEYPQGEIWGWKETLRRYYDNPGDPNHDWYDPNEQPDSCTCPYIPKEEDPQHYYENIGKYGYYYGGWDDWRWTGDAATADSEHHRREYGLMRIESNDNFDHATSMLLVSMLARLASMAQSAWLVHSDLESAPNVSLRARPIPGRGAGIELTFRH